MLYCTVRKVNNYESGTGSRNLALLSMVVNRNITNTTAWSKTSKGTERRNGLLLVEYVGQTP